MRKNVAGQKIGAQLVSATDGSNFTGSVTVYVTGDAGTQAVGSVGSGACTHEGNGYHTYAPAQAETNYDLIAFTFVGTGAVSQTVQVFTTANLVDDVWDEATSGHSTAGTFAKLLTDLAAIFTGMTSLPQWLGLLAGKQTGNSTARTELRATGAGSGTYDETTDSLEAITDTATTFTGKFAGITLLKEWLGLLAGKQTGNSTARTELRATGAGSGTFDETTDSLEALRDRGDAAWTTQSGYIPWATIHLSDTSGTNAYVAISLFSGFFGQWTNIATLDAAATAAIDVRAYGAGAATYLFSDTFTAAELKNGIFEKTYSSPGFSANTLYEVKVTVTANSITYTNWIPLPVGP